MNQQAQELEQLKPSAVVSMEDNSNSISKVMLNPELMQQVQVMAEQMAASKVSVPNHLRGNVGDCYAIALQSVQWKMSPFVVAQKTHLVNGNLGYEAQLVNAVVQASGAITGSFKYEYKGDGNNLSCRVGAMIRGDADITWNEFISFSDITTKNSPLWKTNPRQQLGYLQVKNWSRLYCPGAILGVYSIDELQDSAPMRDVTPREEASHYPEEGFNKNFPRWEAAIRRGQMTKEVVIDTAESKGLLSDAQKQQINDVEEPANANA